MGQDIKQSKQMCTNFMVYSELREQNKESKKRFKICQKNF